MRLVGSDSQQPKSAIPEAEPCLVRGARVKAGTAETLEHTPATNKDKESAKSFRTVQNRPFCRNGFLSKPNCAMLVNGYGEFRSHVVLEPEDRLQLHVLRMGPPRAYRSGTSSR